MIVRVRDPLLALDWGLALMCWDLALALVW